VLVNTYYKYFHSFFSPPALSPRGVFIARNRQRIARRGEKRRLHRLPLFILEKSRKKAKETGI
jgi:hypothetical protein